MQKPILVIMAAGMGSRYGGLKQMDPIGDNGEWLLDFSLYDAYKAGFEKAVFIVREEILEDFKDTVGKRVNGTIDISYAIQDLNDIPKGYAVPENRKKPWGTGHAVYSARELTNGAPVMVINADDYYGPEAFKEIYNYLSKTADSDNCFEYCMVGYKLKSTVTKNGHVARGVCTIDENGYLDSINERVCIKQFADGIKYSEDSEKTWVELSPNTPVSLNCWGFTSSFMSELGVQFIDFMKSILDENSEKAEFFLPSVVENLINTGKARVKVLSSDDKWYGVTYKEDKECVANAILNLKETGVYPHILWK